MNHILIHKAYGYHSMRKVICAMKNDCSILTKIKDSWYSLDNNGIMEQVIISGMLQNPENNIINWGNHIFDNDAYFKINKPSAVALCSNKKESRRKLQENNVAVPETVFNIENVKLEHGVWIARPSHHSKGNNFYELDTPRDIYNLGLIPDGNIDDMYFSLVFNKLNEYRVHCAHGKVLCINEKPLIEGEIRANQAITEEKWKYVKWDDYNKDICVQSLNAMSICGLDVGAVDIMYNKHTDKCAICEINTAPTLADSPYLIGKYASYFDWLIRHDFTVHWDYKRFNDAKSYAWKNFQLSN